MKRVITVTLAVMMLFCIVTNCVSETRADVAEMTADFFKEVIEKLLEAYDASGDALDEDYAELLYRYWKAYRALKDLYGKELQFNIKENPISGNKVFGIDKDSEILWSGVYRSVDDKWIDYVNGVITKSEYMEWMTKFVKTIMAAN